MRRPEGSSRYDPQYVRTDYKNPEKLMVWAGISASGRRRVIHFLDNNQMMTADLYCKTLVKSGAVELLKEDDLILFHDRASVHQAGSVATLLKTEGVKGKFLPGTSADLNPIENAFSRMDQLLESRPIRNLKELRAEVRRAWRTLTY